MSGSFVLILHSHLPYVMRHGDWPHGSDWLCEAAANCYIPLLNECTTLVDDGITPNITFSLTPVLVEQLADEDFPKVFLAYLDNRIEAAESDKRYFEERPYEHSYVPMAEYWHTWYTGRREDFTGRYRSNLVAAFRDLQDRDAIALQTAGATHGYFPLLGRDESIAAQLQTAIASHRRHFGRSPRGVWMPECAYRPCYHWTPPVEGTVAPSGTRKGIEQLLAEHGLEYTVVDSHLTRGGRALGVYAARFESVRKMAEQGQRFLPLDDARSVHDIYRICSTGQPEAGTTVIFSRDTDTTMRVWSGSQGYPGDPNYLEFHKKHHNSGHRYWRITDSQADLAFKQQYRPEWIEERLDAHARHFVMLLEEEMWRFHTSTGRDGTLTAPFDTELFGHWWFEGPRFVGKVMRLLAAGSSVTPRTAPEELDRKDPAVMIQIPEGSWGDGGDHRVWSNPGTDWTWPRIYDVEERFLQLVRTRNADDALETRFLLQLAREQLVMQASDWQFLITTASASDYATERFIEHYDNAMRLIGSIDRIRARRPLSLDETEFLSKLESENRLFPDLSLDNWRDNKNVIGAQG